MLSWRYHVGMSHDDDLVDYATPAEIVIGAFWGLAIAPIPWLVLTIGSFAILGRLTGRRPEAVLVAHGISPLVAMLTYLFAIVGLVTVIFVVHRMEPRHPSTVRWYVFTQDRWFETTALVMAFVLQAAPIALLLFAT
jgi:hypothetical protein